MALICLLAASTVNAQDNATDDIVHSTDIEDNALSANDEQSNTDETIQTDSEKPSTTTYCFSLKEKVGSKVSVSAYIYSEEDLNQPNGGLAVFKINGKTYKTVVNYGDAIVKVKLPVKAKTIKCNVKFLGNDKYKPSSKNFKIKLTKDGVVFLKKNHKVKIGKYMIKLTKKQYKTLLKAYKKDKSKSIKIKTDYIKNIKESYTKKVKKHKTLKTVKTFYSDYRNQFDRMEENGWKLVSENTFTKKNPQASEGIGLSAYTYSISKWVKTVHKKAYKTKSYPVKAKITTKSSYKLPVIKVYAKNKNLGKKSLVIL